MCIEKNDGDSRQTDWRFRIGVSVFVIGILTPLAIPLIMATGLPSYLKTAVSGALAVGIPEIFSLVAVAIMGKAGFDRMKNMFFSFVKRHAPPDSVSATRYRFGLTLFSVPLLSAWVGPYLAHHFQGYAEHQLLIGMTGDVMLVISLFVLGGDFWDKLRSLFLHSAKAQRTVSQTPS